MGVIVVAFRLARKSKRPKVVANSYETTCRTKTIEKSSEKPFSPIAWTDTFFPGTFSHFGINRLE
jgi:hypothetical protein